MARPFVFVDRDGTLIEDRDYAWRVEDYVPLPGAHEAVRRLREAGFGVILVSNQSGIGRGYFDEDDLARFEAHLRDDFAAHGAALDAAYHCPHASDAGCACRKPATGLIERATREYEIDLARSWVIGDKASDMELAERAGCRGILVLTGQGPAYRAQVAADVPVVDDLLDAVAHLGA
jgi:D-glycero-D-manno-heptose 1,7-bisphosphate phosphatase